MSFIFAAGTKGTVSGGGGGGGGTTLAWEQDRAQAADYSENDIVLSLTRTPYSHKALLVHLNNGLLTYGEDYTLVGDDIVILFDKAPDGQDHYFTAQYPYGV